MNEKLALLARFYTNPSRAASDAIDKSSLGFSALCAVVAFVVWSFAGGRFIPAFASPVSFPGLFATFVVIPIVAILVVAVRDSLGSITVVLQREYVSLLICALLAWSAVYIPCGLVTLLFFPALGPALIVLSAFVAHAAFLVLFVFCLRTIFGTTAGCRNRRHDRRMGGSNGIPARVAGYRQFFLSSVVPLAAVHLVPLLFARSSVSRVDGKLAPELSPTTRSIHAESSGCGCALSTWTDLSAKAAI